MRNLPLFGELCYNACDHRTRRGREFFPAPAKFLKQRVTAPLDKLEVLKQVFGHEGFREGQERLVDELPREAFDMPVCLVLS